MINKGNKKRLFLGTATLVLALGLMVFVVEDSKNTREKDKVLTNISKEVKYSTQEGEVKGSNQTMSMPLCSSGVTGYHNGCEACDNTGGWWCGWDPLPDLTYTCGQYCLHRMCGPSACVPDPPSNNPPTAPTYLLTNGQTNPTGVSSTPYFSAVFNDPDSGNTGVHYQIQVNTNSSFNGTTMWDSNKTAMTATAIGARSPNITYNGTTLPQNGTTYYWRIKFWDNKGAEGAWSATAQFTMNLLPTAPTSLLTNGQTNPTGITSAPYFSAVFNDPDSGNTGVHYQIQVNTNSSFNGTTMWDSNKTAMTATAIGARSPNITYNGTTLPQNGTTYYWRIKFWDNKGAEGAWSATAQFTMNSLPTAPTSLLTNGQTNPTGITSAPYFSAVFNDPNSGNTGVHYRIQVNTNSSFSGTTMWDSNKTAMTATAIGARSPNITYNGTTLPQNGTTYYWRIKFWDNKGAEGAWSATAQFTMNLLPTAPTSLLTNGQTNPTGITSAPYFSAVFNDPDSGNTGVHYQIQVNTNSSFNGTTMWDSGKVSMSAVAVGGRSTEVSYQGSSLGLDGTTYYWRIRFWDNLDFTGSWSDYATFQMAMYAQGWLYKKSIKVENDTGSTLTNEDILLTIDTSTLIAEGKLKANCDDIRFEDSDGITLLDYWIEDDCNTTTTKIWIRIPSLPENGKIIHIYYGNSSASKGSLDWNGNIYMYANDACPIGWTRATDLDGRFLYGSNIFGVTGGGSAHSHSNLSCTSSSISTTNISGSTTSGVVSTSIAHTHSLSATVGSATSLPPYRTMVLCYNNHFLLASGLISAFDYTPPMWWTRFDALDNVFPQANIGYGTTGGSSTHTHTYTGAATGGPSATVATGIPFNATGGTITYSGNYKIHTFTSSGTFTPNMAGTVQALIVAGGGGGGYNRGGGGGAGGLTYSSSLSLAAGNITVTVGGGGSGSCSSGVAGSNGGSTSLGSYLTVLGGGGGGSSAKAGSSGGSGGGGACAIGYNTGGAGTTNQGNAGGTGRTSTPWIGGGGGGKSAAGTEGTGGAGWASAISGTSVTYAGGGGGRAGAGGSGGGGTGSDCYSTVAVAGTSNRGGGGGGGCGATSPQSCGAAGGSGVVIVRYTDPSLATPSGVGATSTHTHTVTNGSTGTASNLPPYLTMIFAKANSSVYVTNANILISSELPPLGWSRVSQLDNKFTMGSTTYGTSGGYATHSHSATLSTAAPSATMNIYGSGTNYADSGHTHECVGTSSASNLPPYYSVLYIKRKISQEAYLLSVPSVPRSLHSSIGNSNVTLEWVVPSSNGGATITDYIIEYSGNNGSTWTTFDDGVSTTTSAIVTGLTNGQQYYFRVAAVNSVGQGPYSSNVTATPVNQAPTFTNVTNNSPVAPGSTITWSTTASDPDGQVKLLVCRSAGISNGACTGAQWCSSSLVSSNPSCSYTVPNPTLNGTYNAYVYIVDNQNAPATGLHQGSNSSFVVSSVAPTVVNVVLNGGNAIDLTESNTTAVSITATVVSPNTCSAITSVKAYLYRSGVGYTGCDTLAEGNDNHCYPEITCTLDANSCTDPTSASANYTCVANVQYHADPTDSSVTYSAQNWLATVSATTTLTGTGTLSTGVEMNSLTAIGLTISGIDYGNLLVGQSNDPLNKIITTIPTGNVPLNQSHQGDGVGMCTDFSSTPSCTVGTPIDYSHQRYSLSASTSYASGTALTGSPVLVPIDIPKATNTNPTGKNTWWGISIPPNTLPGEYNGRVFILPVKKNI